MSDDASMPEKVRELLRSGRLPAHCPDRVWGGPGSGQDRCRICGDILSPQQVVIEAEFKSPRGSSSLDFHWRCFALLESEWRRFETDSDCTDKGAGPRLAVDVDP